MPTKIDSDFGAFEMKFLISLFIMSAYALANAQAVSEAPALFKEYLFDMPVTSFIEKGGYQDCSEELGGVALCLDEIDFLEEKPALGLRFSDKKLSTVLLVTEFSEKVYAKIFGALSKNFTLVMMRSKTDFLDLIELEKKVTDRKAFAAKITEYETLHLRNGQLSYLFVEQSSQELKKARTAAEAEAQAPDRARTVELMVVEDQNEAMLMVEFSLPRLKQKKLLQTIDNVKSEKF
jgi:hypothetical protein